MVVGRVSRIWRYPVKSLRGEEPGRALLDVNGIEDDRAFALVDPEGRVLSAKRVPQLLEARARSTEDGVVIELPDGRRVPAVQADEQLSAWLDRPVRVLPPSPGRRATIENEDGSFRGYPGTFFDAAPLHLITTATLATLQRLAPGSRFDARRFRPNLLIDTGVAAGMPEQDWIGRTLRIGAARLDVRGPCRRCVITTLPQDDLPRDREILRTVAREVDTVVGAYALVTVTGEVALGDPVSLDAR